MKIGILTLPLHTNYGGILQAYALQTILERMGHEVYVIKLNVVWRLSWKKKLLCYPKRILLKYIIGNKNIHVFFEEHERKIFPIISKNTNEFIHKYINVYEANDLNEISEQGFFDAYIVGSDQVWRKEYLPWKIEDSFLSFDNRPNTIRIAYAASFGVDTWEYTPTQTKNCRELARRFDLITVRERSGINLCSYHIGVNAHWVLDPTMLLKSNDYTKIVENAKVSKSDGNLLVYILNTSKEKNDIVKRISKEGKLIPNIFTNSVADQNLPLKERIHPMVESWLRGFIDSEYVITDSFHGCVFSILFHKPFVVFENEGRGMSRIISILSMFNLDSRLVSTSNFNTRILLEPINWEEVERILKEQKDKSQELLLKYLKQDSI